MKPREKIFIGIIAIIGVLILGYFYGIEPQLKGLFGKLDKMTTTQNTKVANDAQIKALEDQKVTLSSSQSEVKMEKKVRQVDLPKGETLESTVRSMLNDVISMAQSDASNSLISVKPLAKPAPPPPPAPDPNAPPPDPNAPPVINIADFIDESPFEITFRGTYSSLDKFLKDVSAYNTVVEIKDLTIMPEEKAGDNFQDPTKPLKAVFNISLIIRKN